MSRVFQRREIFGVPVSVTNYEHLVAALIGAAERGESGLVDFMPVHGLVTAVRDPRFEMMLRCFDVVAPDGQPLRWALNRFHSAGLSDRVYGPELMWRLCAAAAREGLPIYLYGDTTEVLERLRRRLERQWPMLRVAGMESPPFRELTEQEDAAAVARINESGARFLFLSLGCPRQEIFAFEHRHRIRPIQLCVGAAFDFHAGTKPMAPVWMQQRGLEWLFRLTSEPGRLWRRYLVTNTLFVSLAARRLLLGR